MISMVIKAGMFALHVVDLKALIICSLVFSVYII